MSVLDAILLGIVQGITEFLPVSSFGHSSILRKFWGISGDFSTLFSVFLHIGTLFALIMMFRRELVMILREWLSLTRDLFINLLIYLKNRKNEKKMGYIRIITSKSRKLAVMVLVGSIPSFILAYQARRLVFIWSLSSVWPAIGFLMTGIVLLVVSISKAGGRKGIIEASLDQSMWIGIAQGLSVFPGISRCGLTISGGLFFGYSRKFAIRYSYLLSVPTVAASLLYELTELSSPALTSSVIVSCIVGMITAAVVGILLLRIIMKFVSRVPFYIFSIYSFVLCIFTLVSNFL